MEAHPDFIVPATWRGEILNVLRSGLRDFSVSRPVRNQKLVEGRPWGVPVPGDPEHVIYVWFDALTNYLTAAGFPDEPERFERTWPADAHVIGKDITRFHCLYWPAMLLSAGLPLPRSVAVHGFMTLDGQRISKTTGNIVDPVQVVQQYGADALRFYLMRDISFERDGDFTQAQPDPALQQRPGQRPGEPAQPHREHDRALLRGGGAGAPRGGSGGRG